MAGPEQDLENRCGEGFAGVRYSCLQGLLLKSALAFGSCLVIPYGKTGLICTRWAPYDTAHHGWHAGFQLSGNLDMYLRGGIPEFPFPHCVHRTRGRPGRQQRSWTRVVGGAEGGVQLQGPREGLALQSGAAGLLTGKLNKLLILPSGRPCLS